MEFTTNELSMLIRYCDVYRDNQERYIRRIRRNYDAQLKAHLERGEECDILHPDDDIAIMKQNKAEAIVIKKKLQIKRKALCE